MFFLNPKEDLIKYGEEHRGKAVEMIKHMENKTHEEGLMDWYFYPEVKTQVWFNNRPQIREGLHHLKDGKLDVLIFKIKWSGL